MTSSILASAPSRNGSRPEPTPLRHLIPTAAGTVDHLLELRALVKQAQAEERRLTAEVLGLCEAQGLRALPGTRAVAIVETRMTLRVDAGLFLEAAGPRAAEALTVNLAAARTLLGEAILRAISETTTTRALRVEALPGGAA